MPTYVYETIPNDQATAPRRFEVSQRMSDDPLTSDPETGLPVRRVITGGIGLLMSSAASSAPACDASMGGACGIGSPCSSGLCGLD